MRTRAILSVWYRVRRTRSARSACCHCDSPARARARTKAVAPSRGRTRSHLGEGDRALQRRSRPAWAIASSPRRSSARWRGQGERVVRRRDRRRRHVGALGSHRPIDAARFSTSAAAESVRVAARAAGAVAARSVARLVSRENRCSDPEADRPVAGSRRSISAVSDMALTTCTHLVTAHSEDMTCPTSWV